MSERRQEAIAPTVKRAAAPAPGRIMQRKCACGTHTPPGAGECDSCRQKRQGNPLQRTAVSPAPLSEIPPIVSQTLSSPGQPLDVATRETMESRFGHDFSGVRIHADSRAAESARAVGALAFTVGKNIVFDSGRFTPQNRSGRQLLAHELTHVVQQSRFSGGTDSLRISDPGEPSEREADAVAVHIAQGGMMASPGVGASRAAEPKLSRAPKTSSGLSPNDCKSANRFQTNREHRIIQEDYVMRQNPSAVKEYQIPESGNWGGTGWADLADPHTRYLFEIKSVWGMYQGVVEAERYQEKANQFCGSGWTLGIFYIPTVFEDPGDPDNVLLAATFGAGVILYSWFRRSQDPVPAQFKRKVEIPEKERKSTPQNQPQQQPAKPQQQPAKPTLVPVPGKQQPKKPPVIVPDLVPTAANTALDELYTIKLGKQTLEKLTRAVALEKVFDYYLRLRNRVDLQAGRHEAEQKRAAEISVLGAIGFLNEVAHNISLPPASIWTEPRNFLSAARGALESGNIKAAVQALANAENAYIQCLTTWLTYLEGREEAAARAQKEIPMIGIAIIAVFVAPQALGALLELLPAGAAGATQTAGAVTGAAGLVKAFGQ